MKTRHLFTTLATLGLAAVITGGAARPVRGVDHNNLDAGRPLTFEDAESIALGEQALETGVTFASPRRPLGLGLRLEYLYGVALNSHLGIEAGASAGGRTGTTHTRPDFDDVSVSLFHNFNREYGRTPALALRGDMTIPTGRGGGGVEFRLRGIVSRMVTQYGRLHLNLDGEFAPNAEADERKTRLAATLGYSVPLGYSRRFDRSGLLEISLTQPEKKGTDPVVSLGLGLRQQVTPRSVLDVGLQSDIAASRSASREAVRLTAGYSTAF